MGQCMHHRVRRACVYGVSTDYCVRESACNRRLTRTRVRVRQPAVACSQYITATNNC